MTPYLNLSANSNVAYYKIFDNSICIQFTDGTIQNYSYEGGAGKDNVEQMKYLAIRGRGLGSFISSTVRFFHDQ